jgi:nucleoside-diphosphate-sugar epimerase
VALVVGAAGFLGSHLVEELLKKDIQVIGVDDFSTGSRDNLEEVIKDRKFHLAAISASDFNLELPRLDYIFFVAEGGYRIENILKLAKSHQAKICFVSSIELYGREISEKLYWFKHNESKIAHFATEEKINARVVRLGPVFGPRMHFRTHDPAIRLIQAQIKDEIQKELGALDFSSRAFYISDAISLIIKSVFAGSTALKIYDGALLVPLKVSEIRQILLDPNWYQERNFTPTELPPWPTPNLLKTMKELSWRLNTPILKALKDTTSFFKGRKTLVPKVVDDENKWPVQKLKLGFRSFEPVSDQNLSEPKAIKTDKKEHKKKPKIKWLVLVGWAIILLGIVYPIASISWGIFSFKNNLEEAAQNLTDGQVDQSLQNLSEAKKGVETIDSFYSSLGVIAKIPSLEGGYLKGEHLIDSLFEVTVAAEETVKGSQKVFEVLKIISGEKAGDISTQIKEAELELSSANSRLSLASLTFNNFLDSSNFPSPINNKLIDIQDRLDVIKVLISRSLAASQLLPQIIAIDDKKSYLLLLQNNSELRATGGFIGTVARVDFENGKLQKLTVNDVYEVDGHLKIHVEPPKEIKEDLGQNDFFLRDSNFEPDFPTAARQAAWFYNQEEGIKVDGVIALNVSAMEELLKALGPVKLADYNEEITENNLFERAVTHAEQGFFPGSQAKRNFMTSLSSEVLNKIFFSPSVNWPGIISSVGKSFTEKQLLIYLDDPKAFSYLVSNNWAGTMPRQPERQEGEVVDFLAVVESNFGANKSNYYLDRALNLETDIGKEGELYHKLRISYTNRSPSNTWPAGKYKNRLRIYLPFGSKLLKASWGELDITQSVTPFVEYGRTGFSVLVELDPKGQKTLNLNWQLNEKIDFVGSRANYRLDIIKQAGTLKDPLEWRLTYPINYRLSTATKGAANAQEYQISTDLSVDRRFEVNFTK